jgi:F-type H+-transporting ATPase subunit delta
MKSGGPFAREYARVLDDLAPAEREAVQSYFRRLGDSLGQIKNFLDHPVIPDSEKLRSLEAIAPQRFSPLMERILGDIIKRKKTFLFAAIADEMERRSDEAQNIHSVVVTSGAELAEHLRTTLTEQLKRYCAGGVKVRFAVDSALIAGFCIKIGDTVIDNSIMTDLEHIRRELMTVAST